MCRDEVVVRREEEEEEDSFIWSAPSLGTFVSNSFPESCFLNVCFCLVISFGGGQG